MHGISPKSFYIVELTLIPVKNMDNDIDIVQQGPVGPILGMICLFAAIFVHFLFDIGCNGADLCIRLGFADDEIVCNGFFYFTQVQRYDLLSFLILYSFNDRFV